MNTKDIEKKWQNIWQEGQYFHALNNSDKEKVLYFSRISIS